MTKDFTARLLDEIKTKASVVGVVIGNRNDKQTWQVQYVTPPTNEQIALIAGIIADFDINAVKPDPIVDSLLYLLTNDTNAAKKSELISSLTELKN